MIESKWNPHGIETKFFRPDQAEWLNDLKESYPWFSTKWIELVAVSENSINVTYDGPPPDNILALFGVTEKHIYCDYYAIEFYQDGKEVLKIYDQDLSKYPLPSLPEGSRLDPIYSGIGVYYPNPDIVKIYFLHDKPEVVYKWWGWQYNHPKKISNLTYFGVEFNRNTMEVLDISQYSIYKDEDPGTIR